MDDLQFFKAIEAYKNHTMRFVNDYIGGDATRLMIYVNPRLSQITIDLMTVQKIDTIKT